MIILAIDPGTTESGWVVYDTEKKGIISKGIDLNIDLAEDFRSKDLHFVDFVAIEMVASYGMPVGATVFETCVFIGRLQEILEQQDLNVDLVYRKEVKICMCGSLKAKDSNVRQAVLDCFPRTGGGATPEVGTKKQQGPLYGVKSHIWPALALAITYERKLNDL